MLGLRRFGWKASITTRAPRGPIASLALGRPLPHPGFEQELPALPFDHQG